MSKLIKILEVQSLFGTDDGNFVTEIYLYIYIFN